MIVQQLHLLSTIFIMYIGHKFYTVMLHPKLKEVITECSSLPLKGWPYRTMVWQVVKKNFLAWCMHY